MRIDLVFPALPPALDGIGDYTARLGQTLASACAVHIWTAQDDARAVPGALLHLVPSMASSRGLSHLVEGIAADPPDVLVVQYNPFSYGRWGLNLHLAPALRRLKARCPRLHLALMVHEPFVRVENWRFAVFTTWQRLQFWRLMRTADTAFVSIAPWVDRFQPWFPATPIHHLPVGSNMPHVPCKRATMRDRLMIAPQATVLGVFGSAHPSRLLGMVNAAAARLARQELQPVVLYIGAAGAAVQDALTADVRLIDAGALPGDDVSRHLAAVDVYLAPFADGVSTRRGSFLVGLQHGLPTVSTVGRDTDAMLRTANGTAFDLVPDTDAEAFAKAVERLVRSVALQEKRRSAASAFYSSHFTWPRIAARLLDKLPLPTPSVPSIAPTCVSALAP
ncbi:glycosyltransferase family 4 protein [Salisaeta longa]|uniref:glycosyltransferase family 4 protein n=1 Tax=Salisaeta longa TaxID=503170 RepID=UPI0003B55180|nr:glycosyltransferase family 4 protein [Salisaeta longa]